MTAADLRREHENIRFHFYSGDAMDVLERLDHENLDFAVMLEPVDTVKYDFLSLPERSEWGGLMKSDYEFAKKQVVTRTELEKMPLILHQRIGLQEETGGWCEKIVFCLVSHIKSKKISAYCTKVSRKY